MDFTHEQIDELQNYAESLTPISDIAVLMDVDAFELRAAIADGSNAISRAYRLGKAKTMLRIRQNELQLADAGSPLAVQLMTYYVRDMDADEDL